MGSVGAERRRPTPAETPEERDVWRAGWREGWREGRDGGGVVQSYSFDSYQLEEEEISKDAPERGVLALSEPGETPRGRQRESVTRPFSEAAVRSTPFARPFDR